jgi:uncharacterized protein DUF4424
MSRLPLLLAAMLGCAGAALANDSAAETAAGGLVLKQNRAIDMVSEDLYVSANQVRVRYVFRNRSRRPVRTIVAFPHPDRDLSLSGEGDISWPSGFTTRVDGRPVRMQVEHRVTARGVDHTALLRRLRVPIAGEDFDTATTRAIERLPAAEQDRLERLGLIEIYGTAPRRFNLRWTIRETWHWQQLFPAGRDLIVEHRYAPGTGGTVSTALGSPALRDSDFVRDTIRRYCIDADFLAGAARLTRAGSPYVNVSEQWLGYILTTGANWRAPIGDFRLVVDKGSPRNLVSFCGEGVRRIGPTQFEIRRRNWRPTQDLHVLILVPTGESD